MKKRIISILPTACMLAYLLSAPKPDLFFTGRAFFYLLKCFIDLAADKLYIPYRL